MSASSAIWLVLTLGSPNSLNRARLVVRTNSLVLRRAMACKFGPSVVDGTAEFGYQVYILIPGIIL